LLSVHFPVKYIRLQNYRTLTKHTLQQNCAS
jgi:hypothetical protein